MPIAGIAGREGPGKPVGSQSLCQMWISTDVRVVVETDKSMPDGRTEDDRHGQEQKTANGQRDGRFPAEAAQGKPPWLTLGRMAIHTLALLFRPSTGSAGLEIGRSPSVFGRHNACRRFDRKKLCADRETGWRPFLPLTPAVRGRIPLALAQQPYNEMTQSRAIVMANRLSHELSPYLLQHAGNPVDWRPWGAEASGSPERSNGRSFCRSATPPVTGAT